MKQLSESLVSVIIPAYNQAQYLHQAIDSVLAQTYPNFEVIVVDDGSTDETADIAKSYGKKLQYIHQDNLGLAGARNTGIQNAKSKLICLLDADDEWLPQYLEKMTNLAIQDPNAAVYYCCAQAMDKYGKKLSQVFGCRADLSGDLLNTLLRANFIIPSTVMLNYKTIKSGDQFDIKFRRKQDRELWIRLLKQGYYFKELHEILVNYRIHEESLTTDVTGGQQAILESVEKHYGSDDGKPESWDTQKRRAYGGAYRYHVLSSIRQQDGWQNSADYLKKALKTDPTLASDKELFYELTLGSQPTGYRDSIEPIDIEANAKSIMKLLNEVFQTLDSSLQSIKQLTYGTACYAISLCAYNMGHLALARNYIWRAGKYKPVMWISTNMPMLFAKSLLGNSLLNKIRNKSS